MHEKKSLPLLPGCLARDSVEELKAYVRSYLYARQADTAAAIEKTLFEDEPIFKGPFVELSMPFRVAPAAHWPLDQRLKWDFDPYHHQMEAFKRLQHQNSRNTLVTTGTGSGKSECFIMPILDYVLHCKEIGKGEGGVKALIMYPMNALIADQGERLCKLANSLGRGIRIGKYTGNAGFRTKHDRDRPEEIIDDRESLCDNPPDILLTNYRMLDLMLFRPEEQTFWGKSTRDVFKYLVLDELHTFDGAQGADVAGLIRRLRLKLGLEFTCVGTSATIAAGSADKPKDVAQGQELLCEFASTLFGTRFQAEDVIVEPRVHPGEFFAPDPALTVPTSKITHDDRLLSSKKGAYEDYVNSLCTRWHADRDPIKRGDWIKRHPLAKTIFDKHRGLAIPELAQLCAISEADLYQFLDLLASARRPVGKGLGPLLKLEVQLWVAAVPYMIRKLTPEPQFRSIFERDEVLRDFLPAVNCRSCGLSGWVAKLDDTRKTEGYLPFADDIAAHVSSLFTEEGWVIFPDKSKSEDAISYVFDSESQALIDVKSLDLSTKRGFLLTALPIDREAEIGKTINRKKKAKTSDQSLCPSCDEPLSLSLTSLGSSIMGSILTGLYLAHGANPSDKKYLIFNDSVQDAAHQAGYISARSFRFNLRRMMWSVAKAQFEKCPDEKSFPWTALGAALKAHITGLWQLGSKGDKEASRILAQIIPQDLWEYWESQNMGNPLRSPDGLKHLSNRLDWEFWVENTVNQDLGWSLRKAQLMRLRPTPVCYQQLLTALQNQAAKHGLKFIQSEDSFLFGMIDQFLRQGVAYHAGLSGCYAKSKFSLWPLYNQASELAAIFNSKGRRPRILSLAAAPAVTNNNDDRLVQYLIPRGSQGNRLTKWVLRHVDASATTQTQVIGFLTDFVTSIAGGSSLFRKLGEKGAEAVVLDLEQFQLTSEKTKSFRCASCGATRLLASDDGTQSIPCSAYSCTGMAIPLEEKELTDSTSFAEYLAKLIDREVVAPFAHSHTGQLDREKREAVEKAFKNDLMPGDLLDKEKGIYFQSRPINVLTCTPTMEMGIDIGSLSGVMLRGFPRSLSNTKQRLGRSGRSSGNSLNFIIAGRSSHDRQFWLNPDLYFRGQIKPPGCDFRTTGFLERHFNAFLFDLFSGTTGGAKFPKSADLDETGLFLSHPVWVGFRDYLHNIDTDPVLDKFIAAVHLMDQGPSEGFYAELREHLAISLTENKLGQAVEKVLRKHDTELSAARATSKRAELAASQQPANAGDWTQRTESLMLADRRDRLSTSDFIFGVLAGEGILPNYAFPEAGVTLDAHIQIPRPQGQGRPKTEKLSISRAPLQALRELVPGKHFYAQGFKIPITRVIPPANFNAKNCYHVLCDSCGAVSPADKELTGLRSSCPKCQQENQDVASLVPLTAVMGDGSFDALQIRDDEETREKGRDQVSIMIDYNSTQVATDGDYACWEDSQQAVIVEFRTAATIHAVARGPVMGHESQYYALCPQCLAVPFYFDKLRVPQFKDRMQRNRHSSDCEHGLSAGHVNIADIKIAFGHRFVSDAIRFHVSDPASLPAAKAGLMLMMRLALKGNPGHIQTLVSFLQEGKKLILTLYDSVPGGTGHLRSLMQFTGLGLSRDTSGLRLLQKRFLQVKKHVQSCACTNGCYQCLYTYDNQFEHHKIEKVAAVEWLERYIDAVWTLSARPLNEQMVHNPCYDNKLENDFFEALAKPKLMDAIKRTRVEKAGGKGQRIYLQLAEDRQVIIERTADTKISLQGAIPHTKPDFSLRDKSSGKNLGFIYTDGAQVHLGSSWGRKSPFLGTDILTRPQLEAEHLPRENHGVSRIATYSYNMVMSWKHWLEGSPLPSAHKNLGTAIYGGKETYSLLCLINSVFVRPDPHGTTWQTYLTSAHIGFVMQSLAQMLGFKNESLLTPNLLHSAFAAIASLSGELREFGALKFSPKEKILIFNGDALPADGQNTASPELIASWELYWMLWQLSPDLVKIKAKAATAKKAQAMVLEGFDDLSSRHQKDLVMALAELGVAPDDFYADHLELANFGVPFASRAKKYVVIDVMDLAEIHDMPALLQDGCILEVVDFQKETAASVAQRIAQRLKGAS
jgi:DEAD/DEAH box helicase domain-containing protein